MKKNLLTIVMLLASMGLFAQVTMTGLAWGDDKEMTSGYKRTMNAGGSDSVKFSYTSTADATVYLAFEAKVDTKWKSINLEIPVAVTAGTGTVTIPFTIPAETEPNEFVRFVVASEAGKGFVKRLKIGTTQVIGYIILLSADGTAPAPVPSVNINSFMWDDSTTMDKPIMETDTLVAKVDYSGATIGEKLYAVVSYKASGVYGATVNNVEIAFTDTMGVATIQIPTRTFDVTDSTANYLRVFLSPAQNANWGDRKDVKMDANPNNDAIYAILSDDPNAAERVKEPIFVYPNPSEGTFYVELTEAADITVYNLAGNIVKAQAGFAGQNSVEVAEAGIFFMTVKDSKGVRQSVLQVK